VSRSLSCDLNGLVPAILIVQAEEQGLSPELFEEVSRIQLERMVWPIALGRGEEVKIHRAPGIFTQEGGENSLAWTRDGIEWRIMGDLPKDEMIKIAESMRP